ILNNWAGLFPGVGSVLVKVVEHGKVEYFPIFRGNNADLNTTLVLALIAVIYIQYTGIKYLGFKNYIKKFINLTNPINFFVGILETISEISKIISFSFRLFGNIFAGEVLLTVMAFLIPVLVSFPFLVLEIFVGFVQALVFSMLVAVFLSGVTSKHH
ncbi:MAG: F0F1 ATP synthase subunit A, partial [Microgenomates group bacterium]